MKSSVHRASVQELIRTTHLIASDLIAPTVVATRAKVITGSKAKSLHSDNLMKVYPTEQFTYPTEQFTYPTEQFTYPTEQFTYPTEQFVYSD